MTALPWVWSFNSQLHHPSLQESLAHSDYRQRYRQMALMWQLLVEAGFYPPLSDPKWELDRVSDD